MNTSETSHLDITVVVPLYNEDESIPELHAWIKRVMSEHQFSHEIIFVDDGSTDQSWPIIEQLSQRDSAVHGIKFRRNYGKERWSLRWTPIYRIAPTKFLNSTA